MKMKTDNDIFSPREIPVLLNETREILDYLQTLSYDELKAIWKASDKITRESYLLIKNMDLERNLSPAIFSFEGIQYQYMGPGTFTYDDLDYIEEHVRILSGLYGVLRPFDGIQAYRLEMKSKLKGWKHSSLYDFWQDRIGKEIWKGTSTILNLASKEYSQLVSKYIPDNVRLIECIFADFIDGRPIEKGTLAKMARGQMVRYMARNKIKEIEDIKDFNSLDYAFKEDLSDERTYVFIREKKK